MSSIECQTEDVEVVEKVVQTDKNYSTSDKSEQTNEDESFKKYPCNYCAINIASKYHLAEHIERCRGTLNMSTTPGLPMLPFFSPRFNQPPNFSMAYRF